MKLSPAMALPVGKLTIGAMARPKPSSSPAPRPKGAVHLRWRRMSPRLVELGSSPGAEN